MTIDNVDYGFGITLPPLEQEQAVESVISALAEVGFGVLTRLDVDRVLKEKMGYDHHPYTILGACNPELAQKALAVEAHIGLLMPCNVLVQQITDGVSVSIIDTDPLLPLVKAQEAKDVMNDARALLVKALGLLVQ